MSTRDKILMAFATVLVIYLSVEAILMILKNTRR